MRNCFALMGVIFLVLLVIGAAIWYTADPGLIADILNEVAGGTTPQIRVTSIATPKVVILPTPTLAPTPEPPPDAVAYRTHVLIRLRHFAAALEAFMQANARLQENQSLMGDPAWRSEVGAVLDELVLASRSLSGFTSVPPEYTAINNWLDRVGPEAEVLRSNYLQGIEKGDQVSLSAAGDGLNRITEYMKQAQVEMVAAGWQP